MTLESLLARLPRRALLALAQRALDAAATRPAEPNTVNATKALARACERLARRST